MKQSEFVAVLNISHAQAIQKMSVSLEKFSQSSANDLPSLISVVAVSAVEAAEDSIISSLIQAGFLSFDE